MARFLFVVIPEKGHLHPMLGPAAHLRDAGHEVTFHAVADLRADLERAGFDCFEGLAHPLALDGPPPPKRGRELTERLSDGPWLRAWIRHLLLDTVPGHVEQLAAILERVRPDAVVVDPMVYAAVIAAERHGLPWAALSNSLNPVLPRAGEVFEPPLDSELLRTVAWLDDDRRRLFETYGVDVDFSGCDALSPHLTVAFTSPGLAGRAVPGVELVGPAEPKGERGDGLVADDPWLLDPRLQADRLRDAPLIVLSFGSQIWYQPERFRAVVEAVRDRPVTLAVAVGELDPRALADPLPENVLVRPYLPQLTLLDRAALLITHGGANSVMEALARGVPLLISPQCNDQFHQAWFLERRGAGRRLDLPQAPREVWRAIEDLLGDHPIRRAAHELADEYRQLDGSRRAADLVAGLAIRAASPPTAEPSGGR